MQHNSKAWFWILLNGLLVMAIVFGIVGTSSLIKRTSSTYPVRTFTVTSEGKVTVVPDVAVVSFSVVSEGGNPAVVQESNTKKMNEAVDFIKEQGVKDEDIKTSSYNLQPLYDYGRDFGRSSIYAYRLTQTVTVKIRDFSHIGVVVAKLPQMGINQINNVQFMVDDPEADKALAREEAFSKAREKAEVMAKQAGVRIVGVVSFYEQGSDFYPIYAERSAVGMGGDSMMPLAPSIEPGSEDVVVQISVTYEIR